MRLTPQQRATVVLRYFEDRGERDTADILGCSVATVRSEAHDALAALRDAMPKVDLRVGGPVVTTDLRDLLELASDDVPEADLATEAWEEARRQHRVVVRRTVLAVGAVAAAGAVVAAVVHEPGPDDSAPDRADALATPGEVGRLESVLVDGIPVFLAPDPETEARLPRYPDAGPLAIPRHLGPGDAASRAVVGVDGVRGVPQRIRAVFLVVAEGGRRSPVVHAPEASPPHVLFPEVRAERVAGHDVGAGPALDRRRPAPGGLPPAGAPRRARRAGRFG